MQAIVTVLCSSCPTPRARNPQHRDREGGSTYARQTIDSKWDEARQMQDNGKEQP